MATCARCDGDGSIKCPDCGGRGETLKHILDSFIEDGSLASYEECEDCGGSGECACPVCNGSGEVDDD